MHSTEPRFLTYVLVNAHTGEVHSTYPSRAAAKSAKTSVGDHALRVRGGKPMPIPASIRGAAADLWQRALAFAMRSGR